MTRPLTVTTPTDTEIVLARTFDAPARLVFAALTDPALLPRWLGAYGWNLVVCEVDLRVGGAWRFVSRGPGGEHLGHGGEYREIVPPARLVFTERFDDQSYPGQSLVTHVLVERAGAGPLPATTTLTSSIRYPSRQARDIVLGYPMARGLGEGFERLDGLLAELCDRNADRARPGKERQL